MLQGLRLTGLAACVAASPTLAQQSNITTDLADVTIDLASGSTLSILRDKGGCPPSCVQPMQAAPGIVTIGELEVIEFLQEFSANGIGLLVDARLPDGFSQGTLPGAVNVPETTLAPENPYRDDLLEALGVRGDDFAGALDLVIFASGPDAPAAPSALRSLVGAGYPASKLRYYRGGVFAWSSLGLSTAVGQ